MKYTFGCCASTLRIEQSEHCSMWSAPEYVHHEKARLAFVQSVYPKVTGFGTDQDISIVDFVDSHMPHVSQRTCAEYFADKILLGALDGGYHRTESMGCIHWQRMLFNAMQNKRYIMVNVFSRFSK